MSAIDLFCAADDQHRVVLLVDVLEQTLEALHAGQTVVLRSGPVTGPSTPCLVACTSRALREPWIREMFATQETLVAICLDDTPLPGPCLRTVDIQTWPARSADSEVEALAVWLFNYAAAATAGAPPEAAAETVVNANRVQVAAGRVAGADRVPVAAASPAGAGGPSALPRAARRRPRTSELRGAIMLAVLVAAGVGMLWLGRPGDSPGPAKEHDIPRQAPDGPGTVLLDGAANGPAAMDAAVVSLGEDQVIGAAPAVSGSPADSEGLEPDLLLPEDQPIAPATHGYSDAIAHLCESGTLAAAQAWAAVLNWKQRRRVQHEPCVRELLQRPGFETLGSRLDLF